MNVSEENKLYALNRFWPITEKWTKVHKRVHEKAAAENDGPLVCTFLN